MASTHRSAVPHPMAALAPTTVKGESNARIEFNDIAQTPKRAMHMAIVAAEYSRFVRTSLGTTVIEVLHLVQRYRRTQNNRSSGPAPGVGGPSTWRLRRPCP